MVLILLFLPLTLKYPSVPLFLARCSHFWHPSSNTMPLQMPMLRLHKISGDLISAVYSPHIYESSRALTSLETNHIMFFLHDVVERSNLASADAQNASSDSNSFYDDATISALSPAESWKIRWLRMILAIDWETINHLKPRLHPLL